MNPAVFQHSFRVTFQIVGPWSESQDHRYFSDESLATAFMHDIKKRSISENRPWPRIDRVMLLRINDELYDLGKSIKISNDP
jgi:hypothetical protein